MKNIDVILCDGESYKTVQRKNILEIPETVLREAVVNAVCHRDYFEFGARIMVEIFRA